MDAHVKPPESFRIAFKRFQKLPLSNLESDPSIIDLDRGLPEHQQHLFTTKTFAGREKLTRIFDAFSGSEDRLNEPISSNVVAFEAEKIPGLVIIPSLLPLSVQLAILSKNFHRDLSNPKHKTNVHFHHRVQYPENGRSFFDLQPCSHSHLEPLDPCIHESLSVRQFLEKKLRWMTLGGQYDWTQKKYPDETPPSFPPDIQRLLHDLFPETKAEAAIVNLYSPGDVLSLHRDVSEFCDRGLISISLGCDGLFMLGLGQNAGPRDPLRQVTVRLRSGDAVYMTGECRYAWHGVPRIIPNTCPEGLQAWPCQHQFSSCQKHPDYTERFDQWRNWLACKRINLNVRQMFEDDDTEHKQRS